MYAAEFPPWRVTAIALALASCGLAIVRPTQRWLSAAGVGAGILVPVIATIVLDIRRDPTSHNLFPLEIIIGLAFGMPPALLGALCGGFTRHITVSRSLVGGTIAALGFAVAAVDAQLRSQRTVRALRCPGAALCSQVGIECVYHVCAGRRLGVLAELRDCTAAHHVVPTLCTAQSGRPRPLGVLHRS